MAKHKKKSSATPGVLGGLIALCLLVVCVVAIARAFPPRSEEAKGGQSSQTEGLQVSTNDDSEQDTDKTSEKTNASTDSVSQTKPSSSSSASDSTSSSTDSSNKTTHDYTSANDTSSFDKDLWYMLLANPDHYLPEDFTFPTANVYSAGRNWVMDARCAEDMKAMLAAAKEDGVDLIICSAYRTIDTQTRNFNNKVQELIQQGYTEEEAKRVAATIIAVPGTSEHHTGLAADIVTPSYQRLNSGFAETEAFEWLYTHCAQFGFVMRYAEDKQDITKIIYEPWHYRYVGKEAATIMMTEGICFEEFLEKYGT